MSNARSRRRMVPAASGVEADGAVGRRGEEVGSDASPLGAWVLVAIAVLGIGLSGYLTSVHYANVPLVCSDQGFVDCTRVLTSIYSVIPGTSIPITVPGLGYFLVSLGLAIAQLRRPSRYGLRQAHAAWAALGMLTAFYLIFIEFVELRTICLFCTGVHILLLLTLLVTLWRLYPKPAAVSPATR